MSDRRSFNRRRKLDRLFKTTVGDFHLVVGEAFTNVRVFATAADVEERFAYLDLELLHTNTRKIHFHNPAIRRTIDVRGGIPETARRHHSPIRPDQREITINLSHDDRINVKKNFRHRSARMTQIWSMFSVLIRGEKVIQTAGSRTTFPSRSLREHRRARGPDVSPLRRQPWRSFPRGNRCRCIPECDGLVCLPFSE